VTMVLPVVRDTIKRDCYGEDILFKLLIFWNALFQKRLFINTNSSLSWLGSHC